MPPKRKRTAPQPSTSAPPKPKLSRLAKQNNITAAQEDEIREAFSLYKVDHRDYADEAEGVLEIKDTRHVLTALGVRIPRTEWPEVLETLDPENEGIVPFSIFFPYAAIHLSHRRGGESEDEDEQEVEDERAAEIDKAYELFTHGKSGPITLAHLRGVAKLVKEEADDEVLKMMLTEANGGDWRRGVARGEFEGVMRRAGVFS